MILWVSFLILALAEASAQVHYSFLIDGTYSSKAGAHNIVTLHRGLYGLENRYLKARWFDENDFVKKAAGITYRLAKTILLDNVVDYLGFLGQHEVFGHGARYREFGFTDNGFTLNLPPPYGNGKGWARTGRLKGNRVVAPHERTAMIFGGSESNIILSGIIRDNWLQRGSMNYRETFLYLYSANDLNAYILRTKYGLRGEGGNDVLNYLRTINSHEGYPDEEDYRLTLDKLAGYAWIGLLDPFQYYSLYTYFKTYLWSGKENHPFPMISLGEVKYLPSFHPGLTPFGPELYFENFFTKDNKIFHFYVRSGEPTFHKFWGFGGRAVNLVQKKRLSLDSQIDIWKQPPVLLGGPSLTESKGGWGGAVLGTVHYRLLGDSSFLHLTVKAGYKTAGYLEGERLSEGLIFRAGISFRGL